MRQKGRIDANEEISSKKDPYDILSKCPSSKGTAVVSRSRPPQQEDESHLQIGFDIIFLRLLPKFRVGQHGEARLHGGDVAHLAASSLRSRRLTR